MKILVIDDRNVELGAAAEQLAAHELTFATKFTVARDLIMKGGWDVVLTDLMMPGERAGLGEKGDPFVGELVPYGFVLALLAKKVGVPKVAIVSSGNHHDHPIFWACDALQRRDERDQRAYSLVVPGLWAFTGYGCPVIQESPYSKDWGKVLEEITK